MRQIFYQHIILIRETFPKHTVHSLIFRFSRYKLNSKHHRTKRNPHKCWKTKSRAIMLKVSRYKWHYLQNTHSNDTGFLIWNSKRQEEVAQLLTVNSIHSKITLQERRENKGILIQRKTKASVTSRPILKEWLKENLHKERK